MKDKTIDVLLSIGIPAGIKGFSYICDAMVLFDTDPYYQDGKISILYIDIAKKNHTTPSRVERSIRHAFEMALSKGDPDMISRYLDPVNTQNSNLLKTLYLRIRQQQRRIKQCNLHDCAIHTEELKAEIYLEALQILSKEIDSLLTRTLESVKSNTDTNID